ncbi:hypothetical protein BC826DRAFT_469833 [Russula brevipes]|nr:hypothetical protein BC826DRAFT_469833 [Russula brevipes]
MHALEVSNAPAGAGLELAASEGHYANAQRSPALRLLPEILAIVFSFHAEANPANSAENEVNLTRMTLAQFRLGWITVTHVCSLWRQVALDHCTLWTHHRFNLGLEWTTEMLRRAGDAPLSLTLSEQVVPFPPSNADAAEVIRQLLHRVSTLVIEEGACTPAVLDTLTLPAPLMTSLAISSGRFAILPRSLFADAAPKLQDLYLCNALPSWTSVALTHLKRLCITVDRHADTSNIPSYADLFNALQAMPNLESLMLMGCLPLCPFPSYLEEQKVQIPKLRYLLLSGHVQGFRQVLEHLDFPPEAAVGGTCLTDDMTGKECRDVLPSLLSYLPRPSLETLDVSWGDRFDRTFYIGGYSTSQEDDSGRPCFFLEDNKRFNIGFQFKFLLWSAEQKLRILKAVCGALPTQQLRNLSGKLDLGKGAWPEIFGGHQELRHIRICSLSTLQSLIPFLGREGVYPQLVSLTLSKMDLNPKQAAVSLVDRLKTARPPKMTKVFIENCRIRRDLVNGMRGITPDIEIRWDEVELPGWFLTTQGFTLGMPSNAPR